MVNLSSLSGDYCTITKPPPNCDLKGLSFISFLFDPEIKSLIMNVHNTSIEPILSFKQLENLEIVVFLLTL